MGAWEIAYYVGGIAFLVLLAVHSWRYATDEKFRRETGDWQSNYRKDLNERLERERKNGK